MGLAKSGIANHGPVFVREEIWQMENPATLKDDLLELHAEEQVSLLDELWNAQEGKDPFFLPEDAQKKLITVARLELEFEDWLPSISAAERRKTFEDIVRHSPKLFGTLLFLKKEREILRFLKEEITDGDLPLMKSSSTGKLVCGSDFHLRSKRQMAQAIIATSKWSPRDRFAFYKEQWRFLAQAFDLDGEHHELEDDRILPYTEDNEDAGENDTAKVNAGGYSEVWSVRFHTGYQNRFNKSSPLIAVKRLSSKHIEDFKKEQSILKTLASKGNPHLIKLLATYLHKKSYHLLFPWAACNLRGYWKQSPSPGWNRTSVLWDFQQIEGIASALCEVHNFKINGSESAIAADPTKLQVPGTGITMDKDEYQYGRHGDIKPENILWFDDVENFGPGGILQIADFGLGRFHGRESRSQLPAKHAIASPTYEPPEIPLNSKVSRAYDIWSLGCVFLEFITWHLGGSQFVDEFNKKRFVADEDLVQNDKFFSIQRSTEGVARAIVRPEVLEWIDENVLTHSRCSTAMSTLLLIVRNDMLVIDPKRRISCMELKERLRKNRASAEADDSILLGTGKRNSPAVETTHQPYRGSLPAFLASKSEIPSITVHEVSIDRLSE